MSASNQMIGDSSLEGTRLVILDVEGEGALQEFDRQVVFADGVKDEPNVAVDERDLGMVLADHDQSQITSAIQQLEGSAEKKCYSNVLKLFKFKCF